MSPQAPTPDVEELRAVAFDLAQRMQAVKEASRDGRFGYGLRWAHESNLGGCDAVDRFIKVALAPTSDKTKDLGECCPTCGKGVGHYRDCAETKGGAG